MDLSTSEKRRVKARKEWIKVFQETNSVTITARKCGVPRSTIYRWIDKYKHNGDIGLVGQSRRPHSFGNLKVTPSIEKTILEIREKYKWGPQRIKNYLDRSNNCTISSTTIWRILKANDVKDVKKYRKKKDFKRYSRPTPGDRLQIDVTKIKAKCYQFTAIDDCTRIKVARIYPNKKAESSLSFLLEVIDYLGELGITIQRVQTDCGKEFYNEAFQLELMEHFIKFRPNPPGKPHLNGKVERGQKTDKEEFYRTLDLKIGIDELKNKLSRWEHFYNFERPHSSLNGKTPIEFLEGVQSKIPPQNTVTTAWWESEEKIKTLVWEKYKKSLNK